jgi:hypothetical protein
MEGPLVLAGLILNLAFFFWLFSSVWRIQNALADIIEVGQQQLHLQRESNTLVRDLVARLGQTGIRP